MSSTEPTPGDETTKPNDATPDTTEPATTPEATPVASTVNAGNPYDELTTRAVNRQLTDLEAQGKAATAPAEAAK